MLELNRLRLQNTGHWKAVRYSTHVPLIKMLTPILFPSYSNTLLVTLNNRIYIRRHHDQRIHVSPLEAGPAPQDVSQPQSITLNASQSYGMESYKFGEPLSPEGDYASQTRVHMVSFIYHVETITVDMWWSTQASHARPPPPSGV